MNLTATQYSQMSGGQLDTNASRQSLHAEDDKVTERESEQSSEVDELKELTMRTGMIRTQKTIRRVPSIKSPSLAASFNKLSGAKKKLTFADSYSSKQKNLTRVASDPSDNLSSIMSHEKLDESSK